MRWCWLVAERVVAVFALVLIVALVAVEIAERTGLTARAAERVLNAHLPDGTWSVQSCSFDLAGPSLAIEGLVWMREGRELGRADLVRATFAPLGPGGIALEEISLRSARIAAGPSLFEAISAHSGTDDADRGARPEQFARRARFEIDDLVVVRAFDGAELARADVVLDLVDRSELLLAIDATDAKGDVGRLEGRGRLEADGTATVDLSARSLPLAPLGGLLDASGLAADGERFAVRGSLSLDGRARGRTDRLDELEWSLEVDELDVDAPTEDLSVKDLTATGRGRWRPDGMTLGELAGVLRGSATWGGSPVHFGWRGNVGAHHGTRASTAPFGEIFVHARDRAAQGPVQAVIERAVRTQAEHVARTFDALRPNGHVDMWFGVRPRPADPGPRGATGTAVDLALHADPDGALGIRVDGWPDDRGGTSGFPLPIDEIEGRVVFGHVGDAAIRDRLAVIGVRGRTGSGDDAAARGRVGVNGWLASPLPPASRARDDVGRRARLHFLIEMSDVPVDAELCRAIERTGAGIDLAERVGPTSGSVRGTVAIAQSTELDGTVVAVDARLEGVDGRWADQDVAFEAARGDIVVRMGARTLEANGGSDDDRRAFGFALDLRGAPRGNPSARLSVAGALRTPDARDSAATTDATLSQWSVGVEDLPLDDPLLTPYTTADPLLAEQLSAAALDATLAGNYQRTQTHFGGEVSERVEVRARDLSARYAGLGFVDGGASDPSGARVLAHRRALDAGAEGRATDPWTFAAEVTAADELGAQWAASVRSRSRTDGLDLAVLAAGVEPAHEIYLDAAGVASDLNLGGLVDGRANLEVGDDSLSIVDASLDLRDNGLRLEGLTLLDLSGRLDYANDRVESQAITGRLANSPFSLRDVRVFVDPTSSAVASPTFELPPGPDGRPVDVRMTARAFARNLALDPRELVPGDPNVARWAAEHRWRGLVDVEGVELAVGLDAAGAPVARARGRLVPHDLYVNYTLPVRLRSARLDVIDLVADSNGVRATARLVDAYGDVAEQTLARTSARIDLQSDRLVIDELTGELGGGTVTGSGRLAETNRAVVLEFGGQQRFDVALSFARVDVGDIIGRLFGSQVQNRGRLTGDLRLSRTGSDQLTDLVGAAELRIDDARLWSVPVVRDVFATLGLDATATFDWLETDLRLADGRLELRDAVAHSPIVILVGGGYLDVDGTLDQRFELHYSLVDRVPLLSQLFYWVQSRLVAIHIGGTVDRPRIELVSLLNFLSGFDDESLLLPLPPKTPLPERF